MRRLVSVTPLVLQPSHEAAELVCELLQCEQHPRGGRAEHRSQRVLERGPKNELEIELNHRIVLSPFAAGRLSHCGIT